jgi:hypothetical protein
MQKLLPRTNSLISEFTKNWDIWEIIYPKNVMQGFKSTESLDIIREKYQLVGNVWSALSQFILYFCCIVYKIKYFLALCDTLLRNNVICSDYVMFNFILLCIFVHYEYNYQCTLLT